MFNLIDKSNMPKSCTYSGTDPNEIMIFCDQESDRQLIITKGNGLLARIPKENIQVAPKNIDKNVEYADSRINAIRGVFHYERVDYIFLYKNTPVIAIEITTHGYTGDNPLQRFARLYYCAKNSIPSIYCAPLARTRYDELDDSDRVASKRNLSSRLTEGFVKLRDLFGTPVVVVPINTDKRGLPITNDITSVLFPVLNHILSHHIDGELSNCIVFKQYLDLTISHSMNSNIRNSEVRIDNIDISTLRDIMQCPSNFINIIGREYFLKGKPDKLLALRALEESSISSIIVTCSENSRIHNKGLSNLINSIASSYNKDELHLLFSGYQWRPDPISGIVANERARLGLDHRLVLIWPRIFYSNNDTRSQLIMEIKNVNNGKSCDLLNLVNERARNHSNSGRSIITFSDNDNQFGIWNSRSKQAKICTDLCDMIILNDAIIIKE